jgi:hypothetical protein
MLVTLGGMVTLVNLLFLNAPGPIAVTGTPSISDGIRTFLLLPLYPVIVIPVSVTVYLKSDVLTADVLLEELLLLAVVLFADVLLVPALPSLAPFAKAKEAATPKTNVTSKTVLFM